MTDKRTCPFCQAQWPITDPEATECPECGLTLTIHEPSDDRSEQTFEFESSEDPTSGETAEKPDTPSRMGETFDIDRQSPSSDTAADSTLIPPDAPKTEALSRDDKTLADPLRTPIADEGSATENAPDPGATDPRLDATVDSTGSVPGETGFMPSDTPSHDESTLDQDSVNIGFGGTASDTADRDVTLDSKGFPAGGQEAAHISQMWSRNFDASLSAGMSLKGDSPSTGSVSNLVIQSRALRTGKDPKAPSADYELLGMLGEGGMGVVYAARQGSIARTVALKMLKADAVRDTKLRLKFLSEAVVTGDLEHPNIIPIYDLGANESGALFYAMKRVKGTPWDQVIATQLQQENIEILMKVGDALGFAHSRCVIHRDLKPENVMLGDFGEVLVMDWGLAVTQENVAHSGMGGTPAYMAPEMAAGPMEEIGPISDIYLLGAILYEIITDQRPHAGKDVMACLMAAARNEIQPTDKEGELLKIAMKAMETDVADRYQTVAEFQTAMREYQAHSESIALSSRAEDELEDARKSDDYQEYARAVFGFEESYGLWQGNDKAAAGIINARHAYAESALRKADFDLGTSLLDKDVSTNIPLLKQLEAGRDERDARQLRLKTAKRVGVGLAAMLFVVITVAFFWISAEEQYARKQQQIAIEQEGIAKKNEKKAIEQEGIAKENEKIAKEQEQIAKTNEARAKEQELIAIEQRAVAVEARQQEEYGAYIARIGLAAAKIDENAFDTAREILDECPQYLRNWEWGRLMHLCTQDLRTFDGQSPVDAVAYAPDGLRFVTGGWDGAARIWNAKSGEVELNIATGAQYVHAVAFSPDGQSIATATNEPGRFISLWNAQDGSLIRHLDGHTDSVVSVQFSKDGSQLLTGSYDETARLWNIETGESREFIGHEWWVWSARFSPDEKQIVTASQDGTAIVWSTETAEPGPPFRGHKKPVFAANFSPDGRYVVSGGYDNRVLIWEPDQIKPFDVTTLVTDRKNPEPPYRALVGHTAGIRSVEFSTDGQRVLSAGHDNAVRVWDVATAKSLKVLRGHAGRIRSCTFSPDGQWVLSASHDGTAKLWSIEGYQEIRVFRGRVLAGHRDAVLSAAFSPDGNRIVTASRDRTARIWSASSGESIKELKEGHDFLASRAVFFPNGQRVITSAVDNSVRVWDVTSGTEVYRLDGTGASAAVDLSRDSRWILTGSDGSYAKLWDAESGALKTTYGNHSSELTAVQFSPDGNIVVTADHKGRLRLSSRNDGKVLWSAHSHSRGITTALFTPDGNRLLTASLDNTVGHWNVKEGREETSLSLRHPDSVLTMDMSADGRTAITACADGVVRLWDVATANLQKELLRSEKPISAVTFSSDGKQALATETNGRVRLLDLETGKEVGADANRGFRQNHRSVWSAIFAPGDEHVLTVGGNEARLWNLKSGQESMTFTPHGAVASASFSPDGKFVATGSWDNGARIWDGNGDAVLKLEGKHKRHVNTAAYSPDGRMVLTASDDGTVRLWDAQSGKHLKAFTGHSAAVRSAVFSEDGKRILTASNDKSARTWDIESGKQLLELTGHEWSVLSAAFSRDGTRIVTASADNTVRLYDASTGQPLPFDLAGHTASVTSAQFSPDGRRVITGSEDNTAKIWDALTGKEILTLKGHTRGVTSVTFSPDGRQALSTSRDGTAILWLTVDWNELNTASR